MKRPHAFVLVPVLGLAVACGGATFTDGSGDGGGPGGDGGGGSGSSGSSASSGAGSSSGTSGSSSGSGSSTSSGSSSSSSGMGSSGSSGSGSSSSSSSGSSGASSSSSGSSSGSSSSGGTGSGPCPTAAPAAGSACAHTGLACEYGDGDVQACDTVATCAAAGWQLQGPTLSDCGTHPATCPTTFAMVPAGSTCLSNGLVCNYLEGRCECAAGGGVIRVIDGSVVSTWFCQNPTTLGCPQRRPQLGSTCTTENLSCDYGACYIEGGTDEMCKDGVWIEVFAACPA